MPPKRAKQVAKLPPGMALLCFGSDLESRIIGEQLGHPGDNVRLADHLSKCDWQGMFFVCLD